MKEHTHMKAVVVTVLALVLGAAIILGGWQAGWWFTKQNINRQYDVNVHSQQYQGAQVDRERNYADAYRAATDPAQKQQITTTFCSVYSELTQPPRDLQEMASTLGCM